MDLFDLHCDTITECCTKDRELYENTGHISLVKAGSLCRWAQIFAVWMPDEYRGEAAVSYFDRVYDRFLCEMQKNSEYIRHCRTSRDIDECFQNGKRAALLSLEGCSALAGSLERIDELYQKGVRLMTLTWNGENELGSGCQCERDGGLTPFGKSAVRKMAQSGIVIDVSHLSARGFDDVAGETDEPFVASHSTSSQVLSSSRAYSEDSMRSCRRNLSDAQLRVISQRGGLVGINFCNSFLGDAGDDGFEAVYRHISHITEVAGERVLAVGGDFDGCDVNPELDGIDKMEALCEFLQKKGLKSSQIDDIFFYNAYNFFKNMI